MFFAAFVSMTRDDRTDFGGDYALSIRNVPSALHNDQGAPLSIVDGPPRTIPHDVYHVPDPRLSDCLDALVSFVTAAWPINEDLAHVRHQICSVRRQTAD